MSQKIEYTFGNRTYTYEIGNISIEQFKKLKQHRNYHYPTKSSIVRDERTYQKIMKIYEYHPEELI